MTKHTTQSIYRNKKIVIWGLGIHGNGPSAVNYFLSQGSKITIIDLKDETELSESLNKISDRNKVKLILGEQQLSDFLDADLIFRSPAIPKENHIFQALLDMGKNIQMSEGFFLQNSKSKNVIGVTGTKGKTTTSHLIAEILRANGKNVYLGGNTDCSAMEILMKAHENDWIVLEISSWDCEGLDFNKISPKIAVLTNISDDHLNRYKDMDDYALSKASIFKYQKQEDILVTFKDGLYTEKYLSMANSKVILVDEADQHYTKELDKATIKGKHNYNNMLLALAISNELKLNEKKTLKALINFKGVKYRQQYIGEINGIKFINDTTATAPKAAIAAIDLYLNENPVFILGGADKSLGYSELVRKVLNTKIDYVLLKGNATDKYVDLGLDSSKIYVDFKKAIMDAYNRAKDKNGIVVLSPGAASFGMFKHEFDRGEQFNAIFNELKEELTNNYPEKTTKIHV